jgi:hypothetical protein
MDATGTHDGEWRCWGGVRGPWLLPDWEKVARDSAGRPVEVRSSQEPQNLDYQIPLVPYLWHTYGMARVRVSTTVDEHLLARARGHEVASAMLL